MTDPNQVATYSIIGIVAVFLVVALTLPSSITGDAAKHATKEGEYAHRLLQSETIRAGKCTSANPTCAEGFFCDAVLQLSPCHPAHTQGRAPVYGGDCVSKYESVQKTKHTHICKNNFQCQSGICQGIHDPPICGSLLPPQISYCIDPTN